MRREFDREADRLERELECGSITYEEFNEAILDLERSYQDAAESAARDAYENERESWLW